MRDKDIIQAAITKAEIDIALEDGTFRKWWNQRKSLNRYGRLFETPRRWFESNKKYNERLLADIRENNDIKKTEKRNAGNAS